MSTRPFTVKASRHFWLTLTPLRGKYTREQLVEILMTIKDCIRELEESGHVRLAGWNEHALSKPPFNDGSHYEFHIYDDDVLVVYFKRERKRTIRMVGVYDHTSIPG